VATSRGQSLDVRWTGHVADHHHAPSSQCRNGIGKHRQISLAATEGQDVGAGFGKCEAYSTSYTLAGARDHGAPPA
jgi:hypothetical protein